MDWTESMKVDLKAVLAGILIAIGSFVFLKVGGIIGAVLFTFGIFCIVKYSLGLFTGVAGTKIKELDKWNILIFNFIGAFLAGYLLSMTNPEVIDKSISLVQTKINDNWLSILLKSIFCGLIVDMSVFLSKRDSSSLPLFIGIPLFIMCGFNHSIADAGYWGIYLSSSILSNSFDIWTNLSFLFYYIFVIGGNYIGCNFRRYFIKD